MSYLQNQASSFKTSIKSQSNFSQARRIINSPPPSTSKSSPASTPGGSTPLPNSGGANNATSNGSSNKKKRPAKSNVVYSQPADTGMGQYIMTQVHFVVQHLREKEVPLTAEQIAGYLSRPLDSTMAHVLRNNERVIYNPVTGTYEFKPIHNIRSATQLLAHLQKVTTAQGLSVKELKDGWAGAQDAIDELEASKDILVTRTKKDGQPRMVWINDKTLNVAIDQEFKDIWHKVPIPPAAELPGELEKENLKPTSVDPATIKKSMKPTTNRKQKKPRRGRVTNTHLEGILKDYF